MPSHNLQENSQARFFQLDTTTARRNQPVESRRGLRQAPRGRGKRRPAQARRIHHAKESLEEARIDRKEFRPMHKASRVQELPQPASPEGGEGRRPPIPECDPSAAAEDRSRQPEGQRGERSPTEAGRNTLRCLQLRSDQQWEEEIPLEPPRKIPRKNERLSLAGEQSEQGTKKGPKVARTRRPAPHADERQRRPSSGRHALLRPPVGRTGHGSNKEAQMPETKPSKQHQKGLLLNPKQKGTAEPPPQMQKQPQLPYSMTAPRDEDPDRFTKNLEGPEQQAEMLKQHSSHIEESLLHTFQRQREAGQLQQSPHPPAAHAWLASLSPQTASGQRREATAPVRSRKR